MKVVAAETANTIRRTPAHRTSDIVSGLAILVRSHLSATSQPAAHAARLSWFGSPCRISTAGPRSPVSGADEH